MKFLRNTESTVEVENEKKSLVGRDEDTNHSRDGRNVLI
jgi:hypothetical protein